MVRRHTAAVMTQSAIRRRQHNTDTQQLNISTPMRRVVAPTTWDLGSDATTSYDVEGGITIRCGGLRTVVTRGIGAVGGGGGGGGGGVTTSGVCRTMLTFVGRGVE